MKKVKWMGMYMGHEDVLCVLVGNSKGTKCIEGLNGDGSDEFETKRGIEEVIDKLVELGLVVRKGNVIVDCANKLDVIKRDNACESFWKFVG
jgi:hypothetical protein